MTHVTAMKKCAHTVIHPSKCGGLESLVEDEVVTSRTAGYYLYNNCPIILNVRFLFCILQCLTSDPLATEVKSAWHNVPINRNNSLKVAGKMQKLNTYALWILRTKQAVSCNFFKLSFLLSVLTLLLWSTVLWAKSIAPTMGIVSPQQIQFLRLCGYNRLTKAALMQDLT